MKGLFVETHRLRTAGVDHSAHSSWCTLALANTFSIVEPKAMEEEESSFSSPLMLWLQQEQKRKESITERKPKKGLVFEISSDDGFQICAESIEGEWLVRSAFHQALLQLLLCSEEACLVEEPRSFLTSAESCRFLAHT